MVHRLSCDIGCNTQILALVKPVCWEKTNPEISTSAISKAWCDSGIACGQAILFGWASRERASEGPRSLQPLLFSAPCGPAARSRVLTRLASLAQIGELARRLIQAEPPFLTLLTGCPPSPIPTPPPPPAHRVIQFVCRHWPGIFEGPLEMKSIIKLCRKNYKSLGRLPTK